MKYRYLSFDALTGRSISLKTGSVSHETVLDDLSDKLVPGVDFPDDLWVSGVGAFYDVDLATRTLKKVPLPVAFKRMGLFDRPSDQTRMQEVTLHYASLEARPTAPRENE